jgi:hypothetical protein
MRHIERGGPPRNGEGRAPTDPANSTKEVDDHTNAGKYIAGIRRRRAASNRISPWRDTCTCRDPWTCGCDAEGPSDRMIAAYEATAETLLALGLPPAPFLPELRAMWRNGGHSRAVVRAIAARWEANA